MAAPAVRGTVATTTFASTVTSMAVNMPASVSSGDLLLALVEVRNAGSWTTIPSGWSSVLSQAGGGSTGQLTAFYKSASGSEGGTTATWVTGTGSTASWQVYAISGWDGTTAPASATTNGDTTTPSSPALTPGFGAAADLWVAVVADAATGSAFTTAPTGFTGFVNTAASSGGSATELASATLQAAASSKTPGAWGFGSNRFWASATIAIKAPALSVSAGASAALRKAPTQLTTSHDANGGYSLYPSNGNLSAYLWDGSFIFLVADGATISLFQSTNPGAASPTASSVQSFAASGATSSSLHNGDIFVAPNGSNGTDVWVAFAENGNVGGAWVAHATYDSSGTWTWDTTTSCVADGNQASTDVNQISVVWTGTYLIVGIRAEASSSVRYSINYTTTKNGTGGWLSSLVQISGLLGSSSHYFGSLLYDATLGCTVAVYSESTGASLDKLKARVLADGSSPALANWGAETDLGAGTNLNFNDFQGAAALLDHSTGRIHVAYYDGSGNNKSIGYVTGTITVSGTSSTITWGSPISVGTQSANNDSPSLALDGHGRLYIFWSNHSTGVAAADVFCALVDSPYTSIGAVGNITGSGTVGYNHAMTPRRDRLVLGYVPLLYVSGTASPYGIQYDNSWLTFSPTVVSAGASIALKAAGLTKSAGASIALKATGLTTSAAATIALSSGATTSSVSAAASIALKAAGLATSAGASVALKAAGLTTPAGASLALKAAGLTASAGASVALKAAGLTAAGGASIALKSTGNTTNAGASLALKAAGLTQSAAAALALRATLTQSAGASFALKAAGITTSAGASVALKAAGLTQSAGARLALKAAGLTASAAATIALAGGGSSAVSAAATIALKATNLTTAAGASLALKAAGLTQPAAASIALKAAGLSRSAAASVALRATLTQSAGASFALKATGVTVQAQAGIALKSTGLSQAAAAALALKAAGLTASAGARVALRATLSQSAGASFALRAAGVAVQAGAALALKATGLSQAAAAIIALKAAGLTASAGASIALSNQVAQFIGPSFTATVSSPGGVDGTSTSLVISASASAPGGVTQTSGGATGVTESANAASGVISATSND